jgi:hypothetical protein
MFEKRRGFFFQMELAKDTAKFGTSIHKLEHEKKGYLLVG